MVVCVPQGSVDSKGQTPTQWREAEKWTYCKDAEFILESKGIDEASP